MLSRGGLRHPGRSWPLGVSGHPRVPEGRPCRQLTCAELITVYDRGLPLPGLRTSEPTPACALGPRWVPSGGCGDQSPQSFLGLKARMPSHQHTGLRAWSTQCSVRVSAGVGRAGREWEWGRGSGEAPGLAVGRRWQVDVASHSPTCDPGTADSVWTAGRGRMAGQGRTSWKCRRLDEVQRDVVVTA